jgi:hypothetical protein
METVTLILHTDKHTIDHLPLAVLLYTLAFLSNLVRRKWTMIQFEDE